MRPYLPVIVGAVLIGPMPALAQPGPARTAESLRSLHLAGRNLLGILQYCQAQGFVGPGAVEAQRDLLRRVPPAPVPEAQEAEEAGRQGIVAFLESRVPVEVAAQAEGILVKTRCQVIALGLEAS